MNINLKKCFPEAAYTFKLIYTNHYLTSYRESDNGACQILRRARFCLRHFFGLCYCQHHAPIQNLVPRAPRLKM